MPDPEFYHKCLYQAFGELQQALPNTRAAARRAAGKALTKRKRACGGKGKTSSRWNVQRSSNSEVLPNSPGQ
jgi:hypothetical protein